MAALITGDDSLAKVPKITTKFLQKKCIDLISAKFPKSPRTYALMGMQLEVQEKLKDAVEYYEYVLTQDPVNIV